VDASPRIEPIIKNLEYWRIEIGALSEKY